ncbi:hypothetical protein NRS6185_00437 [Bacillus subtilis]|nr:hypothetical protein NRS6185_00437 [Bacillus subtilis]
MNFLSKTPEPPYYAVIFSSVKSENDTGYGETAERMVSLAADQPGFLGVESVREADGRGITVSYWDSMDAINHWRHHTEHQAAKEKGKRKKRLVRVVCSPRRKSRQTAAVSGEHE